ncbi:MAG: hypothetical protein ACR2J8_15750, partial [Thermomicrobiales bacterium]
MTDVSPPDVRRAEAVELPFDGGVLRGLGWPGGAGGVILLHAPGGDLDDWQDLPAIIAGETGAAALALDLPGHGMSEDPEGPWDISHVLAAAGRQLNLPPSR